jgi:hypothetical protein
MLPMLGRTTIIIISKVDYAILQSLSMQLARGWLAALVTVRGWLPSI